MAGEFALLDAFAYIAGHDFTTDSNQIQLSPESTILDATTFGSNGWSEIAHGLKTHSFNMQGLWQSALDDAVDPETWGDLAISRVHTIGLKDVETEPAYMFSSAKASYQLGGSVGELAPFTVQGQGSDGVGVVRGGLAKAKGAMNATGVLGSVLNLGAVATDRFLYATFHIFTAGTTATIQVQSDDNAGFTTPTTRATIGPLTARGGTWMTRVAGPITDTYWRFNVSAITGAFVAAGAIGIGK